MKVYFVRMGADGPVKIGVTSNLRKRIKQLGDGAPDELILLAALDGGRGLELRLHRALHASRRRLEWFNPTREVLGVAVLAKEFGLDGIELWLEAKASEIEVRPLAFIPTGDIEADALSLVKICVGNVVARHGKAAAATAMGRSVDRVEAAMLRGYNVPLTALVGLALLDPGAMAPFFRNDALAPRSA